MRPKEAHQVRSHKLIQRSIAKLAEGSKGHHSGCIHHTIETTETVDGGSHHKVGAVGLAKVELHGGHVRTQLGSSLLETGPVPAGKHHLPAAASKLAGDSAAQYS